MVNNYIEPYLYEPILSNLDSFLILAFTQDISNSNGSTQIELAFISILIAILSSISAAIALILNTIHQRKSVKSRLQFHIQKTFERNYDKVGCFLKNKGLGPAIVKNIELQVNYNSHKISEQKSFIEFLEKTFPKWVVFTFPEPGDYIKVNDNFQLFSISEEDLLFAIEAKINETNNSANADEIKKLFYSEYKEMFKKIKITIIYKSLYGRKKNISRNLDELEITEDLLFFKNNFNNH